MNIVEKVKRRLIKTPYGSFWKSQSGESEVNFYDGLFKSRPELHNHFMDYLKSKDVKTVLEIGCGTGTYPIQFKELFFNKEYVGIDFSETAIKFCRKFSTFKFLHGDFAKLELGKFDLVYSLAVIDHVTYPDEFLRKIINLTGKFAFVNAYRGYYPELEKHESHWDNEGGYFIHKLSVNKLNKILLENLSQDQFKIKRFGKETLILIDKEVGK